MRMFVIARHTLRRLFREKILYNIFGISLVLIFFGFLASKLVFGHQDRVILDLGYLFGSLSVFSVAIGIGSRFIRNEIEDRTVYLYLVRPLSRSAFYFGRFFGFAGFILLNLILLSAVVGILVKLSGGTLNGALAQAALLIFFESLVLLSCSIFMSFWLRPALVLMFMLSVLFFGHNHEMIAGLGDGFALLNHLFPNFAPFMMSDRLFYGNTLSFMQWISTVLYSLCWIFGFLLFGNAVFFRKNL